MLRVLGQLLHPIAQFRPVNVQVLRRLHIGHASILDQAHGLKLELAGKLPSLHDPPPAPSKHLTRCLRNRVQATLSAMVFIAILMFLIQPKEVLKWKEDFFQPASLAAGNWVDFAVWLPWSILIDYISLFKTRVILGLLMRMPRERKLVSVAIVAIDYVLYRILFGVGIIICFIAVSTIVGGSP